MGKKLKSEPLDVDTTVYITALQRQVQDLQAYVAALTSIACMATKKKPETIAAEAQQVIQWVREHPDA